MNIKTIALIAGCAVIFIIAFVFGVAYVFNHVDPWLAQFVLIAGIVIAIIISAIIYKKINQPK